MDEQRGDGAQLQIADVEIGARLDAGFFQHLLPPSIVPTNPLAILLPVAYRFDHPDGAVGYGPIDLGSVPKLTTRPLDQFERSTPLRFN